MTWSVYRDSNAVKGLAYYLLDDDILYSLRNHFPQGLVPDWDEYAVVFKI